MTSPVPTPLPRLNRDDLSHANAWKRQTASVLRLLDERARLMGENRRLRARLYQLTQDDPTTTTQEIPCSS